jgi:hypothetical protein
MVQAPENSGVTSDVGVTMSLRPPLPRPGTNAPKPPLGAPKAGPSLTGKPPAGRKPGGPFKPGGPRKPC